MFCKEVSDTDTIFNAIKNPPYTHGQSVLKRICFLFVFYAAVTVFISFDIVFTEIVAKLNLCKDNGFIFACICHAVFAAFRNKEGSTGINCVHRFANLDCACTLYNLPVFLSALVALEAESLSRHNIVKRS